MSREQWRADNFCSLPLKFYFLITLFSFTAPFHPYSLYTSSFLIFSSILPINFLIPHWFILTSYTLPHPHFFIVTPYTLPHSSFFHPYSLYTSSFLIGSSLLPIHFLIPHFFILTPYKLPHSSMVHPYSIYTSSS